MMVSAGAKHHAIYNYLVAKSENVYKRDVDNIVQAHKSSVATKDDDAETAIEIGKFAVKNKGSVISIDETPAGETGVISLTTTHIRNMFMRCGKLIMVDCTHKTNRYVARISFPCAHDYRV